MAQEFITTCGPQASSNDSELANPKPSDLTCFFSAPHVRTSPLAVNVM